VTIVAHSRPFVIGVDTHAKTHTYAVIDATGQSLGCEQFPTTAKGIARAIAWVGRRSRGQAEALWVISRPVAQECRSGTRSRSLRKYAAEAVAMYRERRPSRGTNATRKRVGYLPAADGPAPMIRSAWPGEILGLPSNSSGT